MAKDEGQQLNFLVGQVVRKFKSEGKCVSPALVKKIFEELLEAEFKKFEKDRLT